MHVQYSRTMNHVSVTLKNYLLLIFFFFFFQAEDGIRDLTVTGVQTCAPSDLTRPASTSRGAFWNSLTVPIANWSKPISPSRCPPVSRTVTDSWHSTSSNISTTIKPQ